MKDFWRTRGATFIGTCVVTYIYTGNLFQASSLTLALVATNTVIMYLMLKKK